MRASLGPSGGPAVPLKPYHVICESEGTVERVSCTLDQVLADSGLHLSTDAQYHYTTVINSWGLLG